MSVAINALDRGGFSTRGRSWYDPRVNAIMIHAEAGESVPVTATLPSAVNTVDYETQGGLSTTAPVISGAAISFTLSECAPGSRVRFDVLLATGETVELHCVIGGPVAAFPVRSGDYGTFV